MPTNYENLVTAKANIVTEIATVSAMMGPTYSKDGQTFDKVGYLKSLYEQADKINDLLAQESPYEIRSVFY